VTTTLTVTTNAGPVARALAGVAMTAAFAPLLMSPVVGAWRRRRQRALWAVPAVVSVFVAAACGGGGSDGGPTAAATGTPAGTSTFTVTANSESGAGAGAASNSVTIGLTVTR
jgi:hypothetical protein